MSQQEAKQRVVNAWQSLDLRLRGLGAWVPVAVGGVAGLAITVEQALVRHQTVMQGDTLIYERMANDPFGVHTFPFGFRIGVPWLVHLLPFSHQFSFQLLALLCIAVASGFLYSLMTYLETPPSVAFLLCISFAISPGLLIVLIRNGYNVDAATLLVMIAAAVFTVRRQLALLCITLALGAFVREATIFMIPFAYAIWAERWFDTRALKQAALVALPAVAIYIALRLGIQTVGEEQVIGYGSDLVAGRLDVIDVGLTDWDQSLRRVALAFGPLWLLLPFALKRMKYAQRGIVLLALLLISMTFALDWGRIALLAAPVVYPAAGFVLLKKQRWRIPVIALWLAVSVAYAIYMNSYGVAANVDGGGTPTYPVR